MTIVCLVRHGETDWNYEGRLQGREDIELNCNGKAQASCSADYLSQFHWDIIITSPLKRAKETANIINEKIALESIVEIYDFVERDHGKASGLTHQEINAKFPDGIIPDQEDRMSLKERSMNALNTIVNKYKDMNIIVVSHGGVINSILSEISNGKIGTGKTKLENACINILQHDRSFWSIDLFNKVVDEGCSIKLA